MSVFSTQHFEDEHTETDELQREKPGRHLLVSSPIAHRLVTAFLQGHSGHAAGRVLQAAEVGVPSAHEQVMNVNLYISSENSGGTSKPKNEGSGHGKFRRDQQTQKRRLRTCCVRVLKPVCVSSRYRVQILHCQIPHLLLTACQTTLTRRHKQQARYSCEDRM